MRPTRRGAACSLCATGSSPAPDPPRWPSRCFRTPRCGHERRGPWSQRLAESRRSRLGNDENGAGMKTGRTALIGIGLGLYLLGFGMLAGAAVERMRFDHKRAIVLTRYDEAIREWHAFRMELEKIVDRHPEP